jgi:transcriptional regulator with XRE-family HTH domain
VNDAKVKEVLCNLGARVRVLREGRGLTQAQLAERAGIEPRSIQRVEAGQTGSLGTLVRLAAALDVPIDRMFRRPARIPAREPGRPRKRG